MNVIDLGRKGYAEVWDFQRKLVTKRILDEIADTLILVEHNHVITLGRNRNWKNLLLPKEILRQKGIEVYKVERGGDITYHGPGQLVGYPIFKLKGALAGVRKFIENMEDALILALRGFGIEAHKNDKLVGVWVEDKKVAAIGVAFRRWVSYHGFALNVNTDLTFFDYIVPCGLEDKGVTSIKEILGFEIPMEDVKKLVIQAFETTFFQIPHTH